MVRHLGPLWATSMYKNENFNKTVIKSFHGTRSVPQQIMKNLSLRDPLQILHETICASKPASLGLSHGLFPLPVTRKLKGKKSSIKNIANLKQIHIYRGHAIPSEFMFYDYASSGIKKISTNIYDSNSNNRVQNCYIYSVFHQTFGLIRSIVHDKGLQETYIVFSLITGSFYTTYGLSDCHIIRDTACCLFSECRSAMRVDTGPLTFTVFRELNSSEFVN